jgi:hypothetical protein
LVFGGKAHAGFSAKWQYGNKNPGLENCYLPKMPTMAKWVNRKKYLKNIRNNKWLFQKQVTYEHMMKVVKR